MAEKPKEVPSDRVSKPAQGKVEDTDVTRPAPKPKELKLTKEQIEYLSALPFDELPAPSPEKEAPAKEQYIGYDPLNLFEQTPPLSYPYVLMPKKKCIIKQPRQGRLGRKGYKEEDFLKHIKRHFHHSCKIFDDRLLSVKNGNSPFGPDITLINEDQGLNIYIDIEIDEPYEGINDIQNRKATHFQGVDEKRNLAFTDRGWIVIRFAEIQVHQAPSECCSFIADVIRSIDISFRMPPELEKVRKVNPVRQWTKAEAEEWSERHYREKYLGITGFGTVPESPAILEIEETASEKVVEEKVIETKVHVRSKPPIAVIKDPLSQMIIAQEMGLFISFSYRGSRTIVKPVNIDQSQLKAFCYVKNKICAYNTADLTNVHIKDNYRILHISGPQIGLDRISNAVNTAITYDRFIRMKYTRASWIGHAIDDETGELILDVVESEESTRTISNIQLAINALDPEQIIRYNLNSNYITAYCHRREAQRTFRFDRIGEIEILDL